MRIIEYPCKQYERLKITPIQSEQFVSKREIGGTIKKINGSICYATPCGKSSEVGSCCEFSIKYIQ